MESTIIMSSDEKMDLVNIFRELAELQRPSEVIQNHTRYLEERREARETVKLEEESQDPFYSYPHYSEVLYDEALDEDIPNNVIFISRPNTAEGTLSFSKCFLTREEFGMYSKELQQSPLASQSDNSLFGKIAASTRASELSDNSYIDLVMCERIEDAKRLLSTPANELNGLNLLSVYRANSYSSICMDSDPSLPRLGISQPGPHSTSSVEERQKIYILLGVARALSKAAHANWHHRRLSTSDIVVHNEFLEDFSELKMRSVQNFVYVKVLNFRSPTSFGCHGDCKSCRDEIMKVQKNDLLRSSDISPELGTYKSDGTSTFSFHYIPQRVNKELKISPEAVDMISFSSFLLWIFSGTSLKQFEPMSFQEKERVMKHVPWFFRWIVEDFDSISIHGVFHFLSAVKNNSLELFNLENPFINEYVSAPTSEDTDFNSRCTVPWFSYTPSTLLGYCIIRSILVSLEYNCSSAWFRMGQICENSFIKLGEFSSETALARELERAHRCYEISGKMGCAIAYRNLAKLHLLNSTENNENMFISGTCIGEISDKSVLRNLRDASLLGDTYSLTALQQFFKAGTEKKTLKEMLVPKLDLDSIQPETIFTDRALNLTVMVGKWYRRGFNGLEINITESCDWLRKASELGRLDAKLELGLVWRQVATEKEQIESSVKLLVEVSNSRPAQYGYQACYWLGCWYDTGITIPKPGYSGIETERSDYCSTTEVLRKDERRAAGYIYTAAMQKLPGALGIYGNYLLKGIGGIGENGEEGKKKMLKACELNSSSAVVLEINRQLRTLEKQSQNYIREKSSSSLSSQRSNDSNRSNKSRSDPITNTESHRKFKEKVNNVLETKISDLQKLYHDMRATVEEPPENIDYSDLAYLKFEQGLDPAPLLFASKQIFGFVQIWTWCIDEVRSINLSKAEFRKEKLRNSEDLAKLAIQIVEEDIWKQYRVNYVHADGKVAEEAKQFLIKHFS